MKDDEDMMGFGTAPNQQQHPSHYSPESRRNPSKQYSSSSSSVTKIATSRLSMRQTTNCHSNSGARVHGRDEGWTIHEVVLSSILLPPAWPPLPLLPTPTNTNDHTDHHSIRNTLLCEAASDRKDVGSPLASGGFAAAHQMLLTSCCTN